ncbi:MAG: response regulator [Elusimicrobia bacterium]|nr:response regulator [Elusimicrobiota bacterium]
MKNLLIVDDNDEFRTMVGYYFTDLGYHVDIAVNGREGIDKAVKLKPDVILLDVMMPDVGGIEVLRQLQSNDDTRTIPVIVITGTYFDNKMKELFQQESNCREFLTKTAELSYIHKKIEGLTSADNSSHKS